MRHPLLASPPVALLALASVAACTDGTGPGIGDTLRSGRAVAGRVGGGDTDWFRYVAAPREGFEIRFTAPSAVSLRRRLPSGEIVSLLSGFPAPGETVTRSARISVLGTGAVIDMQVIGSGSYRLEVLGQNRRPETHDGTVALDEVADEQLDTARDADEFTFTLATPTTIDARIELRATLVGSHQIFGYVRPVPDDRPDSFEPLVLQIFPGAPAGTIATTGARSLPAGKYVLSIERDSFSDRTEPPLSYRATAQRMRTAR